MVRLLNVEGDEIPIVLISSIVDLTAPVDIPDELLDEPWVIVFPVPDTVKMGLTPLIAFPFASLRVRVMAARSVLLAFTAPLDTTRVDLVASGAPAKKVTDLLLNEARAGLARLTVLVSAIVDARLLVNSPEALVTPVLGDRDA